MTQLRLASLFAALLACSTATAGGMDSGGGDAATCHNDSTNSSQMWSLDYLYGLNRKVYLESKGLSTRYHEVAQRLSSQTHGQDILHEIQARIVSLFPENKVTKGYVEFVDLLDNETDYRKNRVWEGGAQLADIQDEHLLRSLQCPFSANRPHSKFKQIVIREKRDHYMPIVYHYDNEALGLLTKTGPLQVSSIYVHEWLRDHLKNAETIRKTNVFLHSKFFFEASAGEICDELSKRGFDAIATKVHFPKDGGQPYFTCD